VVCDVEVEQMSDSWLIEICPRCDTANWIDDGHALDENIPEVGAYRCFKCRAVVVLLDNNTIIMDGTRDLLVNDAMIVDGVREMTARAGCNGAEL
jgi:hypothetical protein